jgi:hypothetical protein
MKYKPVVTIKSIYNKYDYGYKYIFQKGTWADILGEFPKRNIQKEFIRILRDVPPSKNSDSDLSIKSYYFQTPNICSLNIPIEFVLMKTHNLHKKKADWSKYAEYMNRKPRNRHSLSFINLTGNIMLTIPFNKKKNIRYGHIKDYMTYASMEEIYDIFLEIGIQIEIYNEASRRHSSINKSNVATTTSNISICHPLYLSTHGHGVQWLHFRLEEKPLYYNYNYYKNY